MMHTGIKATKEGLVGQKTTSGWVINDHVPFVALPSHAALRCWVNVYNRTNGNYTRALVLDVGPWNENDDAYVFGGERPAAESGKSVSGQGTNNAGIDLGNAVWEALGMTDNGPVDWEFV